jgi:hypothetical protein
MKVGFEIDQEGQEMFSTLGISDRVFDGAK